MHELEKRAADWEVTPDLVTRARENLIGILDLIADGGCAVDRVRVQLAYDDFSLATEIIYRGSRPSIASDQQVSGDLLEEQSFAVGLSGFLSGINPDRIDRHADGDKCRIKMVFDN